MISGFKVDLLLKMQGTIIERFCGLLQRKTEANMISYLNVDLRLKMQGTWSSTHRSTIERFCGLVQRKTEAHMISGFKVDLRLKMQGTIIERFVWTPEKNRGKHDFLFER